MFLDVKCCQTSLDPVSHKVISTNYIMKPFFE